MSLIKKWRDSLKKTSDKISTSIKDVVTKVKLDEDQIDQIEAELIQADLGLKVTHELIAILKRERFEKNASAISVLGQLHDHITAILKPFEKPFKIAKEAPLVILMVGVNGSGKTTSMAKLAQKFKAEKKDILLAAGDTFRAAATAQLKVWAERLKVDLYAKDEGADAAALAYEAYQRAIKEKKDVLMIDTAGRLHNRSDLMSELEKIVRVLKKINPDAPHEVCLVIDATIGQNALAQVKTFKEIIGLTGIIITKLDGSAKAGVVIPLVQDFGIPIRAVGLGEQADDLVDFSADDFASGLLGQKD